MPNKIISLDGKRFGRLLVKKRVKNKGEKLYWLCLCECGKEKVIRGSSLKGSNGTRSCGCLAKELASKRNSTHRMTSTAFYKNWRNMISRCTNKNYPQYKYYGGRGITVCKRWLKFENFRNDMYQSYLFHKKNNKTTSIDRIENEKNYSPANCCWATTQQQANNKSNNRLITYKNRTQTISQWARQLNISYKLIWDRLNSGWSVEKSLTS